MQNYPKNSKNSPVADYYREDTIYLVILINNINRGKYIKIVTKTPPNFWNSYGNEIWYGPRVAQPLPTAGNSINPCLG